MLWKIVMVQVIITGVMSIIIMFILPLLSVLYASAEKGVIFTVSPMDEKIVLNPGDEYSSSLEIFIPDKYENDIKYNVEIAPYFVDENYNNDFNNTYGTNNELVKWISFDTPEKGRLSPGQKATIVYTINVPEDAAGGGQYASVLVSADSWQDTEESIDNGDNSDVVGAALREEKKIAHTIYAEITGDITRQGEIVETNVSGFLLSGNIFGSSMIKNTGNVHGDAKYTLQVFPLFSDEEIYTNEEQPQDRTILPDRTLYNETAWANTPAMGIFNVIYTVEFEGVTTQVSKMVIKCPVWLLFIIIFGIITLIIWFFLIAKKRRGTKRER